MEIASIGLQTELALARTHGRVTDRGDYMVVEIPAMSTWAAANYLLIPSAPSAIDVQRWIDTFDRELGTERSLSFRLGDTSADESALREAGFEIDETDMFVANEVLAPPHAMPIRALESGEVLQTSVLAWTISDRHDEVLRKLLHARAAWFADLVDRGLATFWGAFDTDKLVASVGLVRLGALARFQDVQTLPAYRRRGLSGALLATAARATRGYRYVIGAVPDSDGARVYRRVGFQRLERLVIARRRR